MGRMRMARLCGLCRQAGHDRRRCQQSITYIKKREPVKVYMPLQTEDTGKEFEMAICLAYGIEYDGKFKYSMETCEALKPRLLLLTLMFPTCRHTARKGSRYDYTALSNDTLHLSAKSSKLPMGKIAPQVIGQSNPQKFCELTNIPFTTIADLKQTIQTDIRRILGVLIDYTFDCPTIYYNKAKNTIQYITLESPIDWTNCEFVWTCDWTTWKNSSTLKIKHNNQYIPLLEVQFHTKSRQNMALRWCFDNVLTIWKDNLTIMSM